jgi:hypothetical protein
VIRATVEHIGLVGDTELTVNVRWPASSFCVQAGKKPAVSADQASDSQFVPENGPDAVLWGEAADPGPYTEAKSRGSQAEAVHTSSNPEAEASSTRPEPEHTVSTTATNAWPDAETKSQTSS